MFTMQELLGPHKLGECTPEQKVNLTVLLAKLNKLRADYGKPLKVTSGLRNDVDMKRIYKSDVYPKKSKHLFGQAVDISDPKHELINWLKEDNSRRMKLYGFWGENLTTNWCHLQMVPMSSYKETTDVRWFNP